MNRKALILTVALAVLSITVGNYTFAQNRNVTPDMIRQAEGVYGTDAIRKALDEQKSGPQIVKDKDSSRDIQENRKRNDPSDNSNNSNGAGGQNNANGRNNSNIQRNSNDPRLSTTNKTAIDPRTGLPIDGMNNEDVYFPVGEVVDEALAAHKKDSILQNSVFGREIFSNTNLTFSPSYNIPTPRNYVLAGGDKVYIDISGSAEANYERVITPDGSIILPDVGTINLSGLTIEQATARLNNRLSSAIAGLADGTASLNLTLGDVRSIKVNIIGEASVPGTYTLPSLATLFNAIYAAGGVSDIGSLRNIRLVRDGKQIAVLDVYDYLIGGKQEVNVGLAEGDMIIINPYEELVKVKGKVKRPRVYELKKGQSVAEILDYAGGFMGQAYKDNVTITRKSGRLHTIHNVPSEEFGNFAMSDGDRLVVGDVIDLYANRVTIDGAVWRPGDYELGDSVLSLKQLIHKAEGVRGDALMSRTQVTRLRDDFTVEVLSVDLGDLLADKIPDVELKPEDIISIPSVNSIREGYTITTKGEVNNPNIMPYRSNMTIEDVILLSGGLKESASLARIEVARRVKNPTSTENTSRIAELFSFNIPANLGLDAETAQFTLQPFDEIYVRTSPGYSAQESVFIEGEVLFPGEYVLSSTYDRLSDLVTKASGVAPEAYLKGAYLKRKVSEDRLARIETLRDLSSRGKSVTGDTLMTKQLQLGDYYPIAIDLVAALENPKGEGNLILQAGDMLVIPKYNSTVTISGAVLYPCVVSYVEGDRIRDYIAKGGGYGDRAKKQPFVIYANGMPMARLKGKKPPIEPGCEIVVPQKGPKGQGMSPAEIMSLSTTTLSLITMATSLFVK